MGPTLVAMATKFGWARHGDPVSYWLVSFLVCKRDQITPDTHTLLLFFKRPILPQSPG